MFSVIRPEVCGGNTTHRIMHHNIAATDLSSVDVCVHQPCCVHTSLVSRCASRALHSQTMLRPTRSCFPSSTRCSSGRTRRVPPSHRRRRQASCARRWSAQSAHQPPQRYVCNNTLAEQNLLHQHVTFARECGQWRHHPMDSSTLNIPLLSFLLSWML